jgi:hypothetical protein
LVAIERSVPLALTAVDDTTGSTEPRRAIPGDEEGRAPDRPGDPKPAPGLAGAPRRPHGANGLVWNPVTRPGDQGVQLVFGSHRPCPSSSLNVGIALPWAERHWEATAGSDSTNGRLRPSGRVFRAAMRAPSVRCHGGSSHLTWFDPSSPPGISRPDRRRCLLRRTTRRRPSVSSAAGEIGTVRSWPTASKSTWDSAGAAHAQANGAAAVPRRVAGVADRLEQPQRTRRIRSRQAARRPARGQAFPPAGRPEGATSGPFRVAPRPTRGAVQS